jgi:deazaflavin-dependent oxidoreductase (nitroreductase family)
VTNADADTAAEGEQIFDSPTAWVAAHVRRYVNSGGTRGHRWNGVDTLLITTRGRKTGRLRRTALIYGKDGDRYIVVGSNGGRPNHPAWYLNLVDHPGVRVQVGTSSFVALARTATAEEKPRLWALMAAIFPQYNGYQKRTAREIPVVILDPADV